MCNMYTSHRSMDDEPEQPLHQAEVLELTPRERATARKQTRTATASAQESLFLTLSASFSASLFSCDEAVVTQPYSIHNNTIAALKFHFYVSVGCLECRGVLCYGDIGRYVDVRYEAEGVDNKCRWCFYDG